MRKWLVILFLFCGLILKATDSNYYFSNDGDDDTGDGSIETPYASITKLNTIVLAADDTVFFARGDIFRGQVTVSASGTDGHYIVFRPYGTGDKPKLTRSTQAITWGNISGNLWGSATAVTDPYNTTSYDAEIWFEELAGTVSWGNPKKTWDSDLSNLTEEYDWTWHGDSVYVYAETDPDMRYSAVEVPQGDYNIYLNGKDYITIDSLDLRYCILANIKALYNVAARTGLEVKYCDISYNGYRGSAVGYGISSWYSDSHYHHNVIHDVGRRGIDVNLIIASQTMTDVIIENNEIYGCHHSGIDVSTSAASDVIDGVIIRNNLIYEKTTHPYWTYEQTMLPIYLGNAGSGATVKNVYIYNNVIRDARRGHIQLYKSDSIYIWNNTLTNADISTYDDLTGQIYMSYNTNTWIKNNILYNTSANNNSLHNYSLVVKGFLAATLTTTYSDYNLFYCPAETMIQWNNVSYLQNQWSTYKTATGQDGNSPSPADPVFTTEFTDLTLQAGSTAIGAGIGVGINTDYEGNEVNSPSDLGAYAYDSDPPDPPGLPTVTTTAITSYTSVYAEGAGNVTSDGGGTITDRGVVWGTSANPTTSNSKASTTGTTGSYSVRLRNLSGGTTYHYRAYTTNESGTAYGEDKTFTTDERSLNKSTNGKILRYNGKTINIR